MVKTNHPLELDVLKSIENYLGFKFPDKYKIFLLSCNGGETKKKIFFFQKDTLNGSILDRLFGVVSNEYESILIYLKDYRTRIPDNFCPIGADPGGNLILISVKGPDYGKIYFWDHEMEVDEGEEPDYSNLTLIADSFTDFINSLHEK